MTAILRPCDNSIPRPEAVWAGRLIQSGLSQVKFKAPAPSAATTWGVLLDFLGSIPIAIAGHPIGGLHEKFAAARRSPFGVRSVADGGCNAGLGAGPRPKAAELCTPDVMRLCSEFVPDVDLITGCMQKNLARSSVSNARLCSSQSEGGTRLSARIEPTAAALVEKKKAKAAKCATSCTRLMVGRGWDFLKNPPRQEWGSRGAPGRDYSAGSKETICF